MKKLEVPGEIIDLFNEVAACNQCRDSCIKSLFKARRAIYYAKLSHKASIKAWRIARELWPEIMDGSWSYSYDTQTINGDEDINTVNG